MATKTTAASRKTTPAKNAAAGKGQSGVKARASADNRWAGIQLPEGFTPITNGDYGQEWDYENDPILVGKVASDVRVIELKRGKVMESQRVVTVIDEQTGVLYSIWESAALSSWFDAIEKDMRVAIAFQGYRDTGKGSPLKMFIGSIEPPADGDDMPSPKASRSKPPAKKTSGRRATQNGPAF